MKKALIIYACLYATLICWHPYLGPIDDEHFLQPFKFLKFWYGDRFYILDGIEQFIITLNFGIQPFLYYLINALEFLALFYLLVRISKKAFESQPRLAFWVPILATLTPGLPTAYLRLLIPERLLVLCLSTIVLLDLEGKKNKLRKTLYILAIIVGLLLKEPTFLVVGGLSFFRFIEKKDRRFHFGIMLLCTGYLALYLILTRIISPATSQYGSSSIHGLPLLAKNIFNYVLNDPAVFLFAIPTLVLLLKKRVLDPYLSLIIGYVLILLYLGIYQEYYLLPTLPFLIVSIGKYWSTTPRFQRSLVAILIINSVIYGLGQISIYKNEPRGFTETITTLTNEKFNEHKTMCYLGLNEEFSHEIVYSSGEFFKNKNLNAITPKFSSTENSNDPLCDYKIDSPYNYSRVKVASNWNSISHFKPVFYFPSFSIKTWIKYFASQINPKALINQNLFRKHDFIIYQRESRPRI